MEKTQWCCGIVSHIGQCLRCFVRDNTAEVAVALSICRLYIECVVDRPFVWRINISFERPVDVI